MPCLCQVVYQGKEDQVTVVAAGVTLHEALAAAEHLKKGALHYLVTKERMEHCLCLNTFQSKFADKMQER